MNTIVPKTMDNRKGFEVSRTVSEEGLGEIEGGMVSRM